MCAPPSSRARNDASSPLSRSGGMARALSPIERRAGRTAWRVGSITQAVCQPSTARIMQAVLEPTGDPQMRPTLSDPKRFSAVYDEHHRGVYAAALRIVGDPAQAQDVVQDVFLRLWRRPEAFDARRGQLGPYLRLMARSRALDLWREGQAAGRASDRLKMVTPEDDGRPEERPDARVDREEGRGAVREALRRLPSTQREALVLAYWGGLTADQIAQRSRVPLGTAKSRIRLGLARLRDECGEELGVTATAA